VELTIHAKTLDTRRESYSLLTINGGSSSIRFALFDGGEPLRRLLDGKVDRVGLSGTNLTFRDATGQLQNSRTIDSSDRHSAVGFLLDWLPNFCFGMPWAEHRHRLPSFTAFARFLPVQLITQGRADRTRALRAPSAPGTHREARSWRQRRFQMTSGAPLAGWIGLQIRLIDATGS